MKKEMPKKWFYKHLLSSEYDGSLLVKGRFYEDEKIAKIHDGAVVSIGDLEAHSVYSAVKDLDVRKITAPVSISDEIGIVDLVNVSEGRIGDNIYREGIKTIGLTVDAGIPVRVRRLNKGDSFYEAKGNFIGEVQEGKFAIPTKGDTRWTIVDNATVGTTAIKIDFVLPLVEGTVVTDDKILCTVTQIACPSGASGSAITTEQIEDGAITTSKLADEVNNRITSIQNSIIGKKGTGENAEQFNESNRAYGDYSHAEGSDTTAKGHYSHSEGISTSANGNISHAEGSGTQANGQYSHTEGYETIAESEASHAEGYRTQATTNSQHVQGRYNIKDTNNKYAHIVGNGNSDSTRSNAHTVDWSGNSWYQGNIKVGGTSYIDPKAKEVATTDLLIGKIGDGTKSEVFNDYSNNKIYGVYSHVENDTGVVGKKGKENYIVSCHFENKAGANIESYCTLKLYIDDSGTPTEFRTDGTSLDDAQVGDIVIGELSEKAKIYAIVSEKTDKIVKFTEYYLSDEYNQFVNEQEVKAIVVRYDSEKKGYSIIQKGDRTNFISNSHGEGSTILTDGHQHGEGYNTRPYGKGSHTEGKDTVTFGDYSHAEGNGSAAFGFSAHAEGSETRAIGSWSHAEGKVSYAYGTFSHAEGVKTHAKGSSSHSEGTQTLADGEGAHAEGKFNKALNRSAHAEGEATTASGVSSHSEGGGTVALGENAHAEGSGSHANGDGSHSEGRLNNAEGANSHAEGQNTTAKGEQSHSEGYKTVAEGSSSHAEGFGTKASGLYQHVQGKYNIVDEGNTYADIVGGGTEEERKNIQTLDWSGNSWNAGNIKIGGTGYDDVNAKEVATVDIKLTALELTVDADGKVTGGTATLANGNTIAVTIKTA